MKDFIKEAFDCIAAANSVTTLTLGEMEKVVRDCYNEFLARSHDWQPIETAPKGKLLLTAYVRNESPQHYMIRFSANHSLILEPGFTAKYWIETPKLPDLPEGPDEE